MLRRLQVSTGRGMPQLSAPVLMAASRGNADFLCTLPVKHNDGPAQACRSSSASAHSLSLDISPGRGAPVSAV